MLTAELEKRIEFAMAEAASPKLSIGDDIRLVTTDAEYSRARFLGIESGGRWAVGYYRSKDSDRSGSRPWQGGKTEWHVDHVMPASIVKCQRMD